MTSEELLARLLLVTVVAAQLQALALIWKRHSRFAAAAIFFSPMLFLYFVSLVNRTSSESAQIGLTSWFGIAVFVLLIAPAALSLLFLFGMRLRIGLLWFAWGLNWVPLAFLFLMTFFFEIRF